VIIGRILSKFPGIGSASSVGKLGFSTDGAASLNPIFIRWWLVAFPAAAMAVTLLALNFLGDALRDALDPKR
jgi:ABC-type dipeptide/oligopeptide/nickel transport system permease subunit